MKYLSTVLILFSTSHFLKKITSFCFFFVSFFRSYSSVQIDGSGAWREEETGEEGEEREGWWGREEQDDQLLGQVHAGAQTSGIKKKRKKSRK